MWCWSTAGTARRSKADALAQVNMNGAGNTIDPGLRARTLLPATLGAA